MADPRFLSVDEVIAIHADQIARYGGRQGLRDVELLQSALGMPEAGVGEHYLHVDLHEMAAAYLYYIVRNHPFTDGNKRTAAMAAFVFLKMNGWTLNVSDSAFEEIVVKAAQGDVGKDSIAEFFRNHARS